MTIGKTEADGKVILKPVGRLDTNTAPQLQAELLPLFSKLKNIVLDFKDLVYVSSAGLRVLLHSQKTANANGAVQTLVNVSPDIKEVFDLTGFSDILTIE